MYSCAGFQTDLCSALWYNMKVVNSFVGRPLWNTKEVRVVSIFKVKAKHRYLFNNLKFRDGSTLHQDKKNFLKDIFVKKKKKLSFIVCTQGASIISLFFVNPHDINAVY